MRDAAGEWKPLLRASFSASGSVWEAKETIDAGVVDGKFYLQTGGETKMSAALGSKFERPAGDGKRPEIPVD